CGDRGDAHHQHDNGSNVVVKPRLLRKAERRRAEQDGSAQADEGDGDGHAVAVCFQIPNGDGARPLFIRSFRIHVAFIVSHFKNGSATKSSSNEGGPEDIRPGRLSRAGRSRQRHSTLPARTGRRSKIASRWPRTMWASPNPNSPAPNMLPDSMVHATSETTAPTIAT